MFRPSSIRITELTSGLLLDCVIMLKSSSSKNGLFQRARGVVLGVVTGVEYRLKFVGLITPPDIVEIELG